MNIKEASIRQTLGLIPALVLFAMCNSPTTFGQNVNDGFDPNANGPIWAIALQADGKIIIGGEFNNVGGINRGGLARLNVDGSVDTAFDAQADGGVFSLAVQSDGKIVVGGRFSTLAGQQRHFIGRINSNGSLDPAFDPGASVDGCPCGAVSSLAVQRDGKILVGGYLTRLGGDLRANLGRLNADGTLDTAFNPGAGDVVTSFAVQADGRILVGGLFNTLGGQTRERIARLTADGGLDSLFNPGANDNVNSFAVQVDGKIVIAGGFTILGGGPRTNIARLNPDGSLDTTFNPGANSDNGVTALALQADGKILVGGAFTILGGQAHTNIGRLHADGSVDGSFNMRANSRVATLAVQSDGKILAGGDFTMLGGTNRNHIGRLYVDGSLDATLNPMLGVHNQDAPISVLGLAAQPDGKILLGGNFSLLAGQPHTNVARLNPDGSVDGAFAPSANSFVRNLLVQVDGKIILAGGFTELNGQARHWIGRLNADGSLDADYNPGATDTGNGYIGLGSLAVQADGKVLVAGPFDRLAGQPRNGIGRLTVDGNLDNSFNPSVVNSAFSVAVQADGKILVAGYFSTPGGQPLARLGRLKIDGSEDISFSMGATGFVATIAVQADGKILVGGYFTSLHGQPRNYLGRLHSDGSLDAAFNPGATYPPGSGNLPFVNSFAVQTDGRIVVSGLFTTLGGQPRQFIGRLNADGSLDASFNPGSGGDYVTCLAVQADGKIAVGGIFTTLWGQPRNQMGRLTSGSAALQVLALDEAGTGAIWMRSGSAPEVEQVTFEESMDGTNYVLLGSGERMAGGWKLTGIPWPTGQSFFLRARGRATGGLRSSHSSLIERVAQFWRLPPPSLSSLQVLGNGAFQFSFTNTNATSFSVLASTNVALPLTQWEVLGPAVPVGDGLFRFTHPAAMNHARFFYQLRSP